MLTCTLCVLLLCTLSAYASDYVDPVVTSHVVVLECQLNTADDFNIIIVPEWSPLGAERFLTLVDEKFYDNFALFRAVDNFLVQFGIARDRELNNNWRGRTIQDDPKIRIKLQKGSLAFAGSGEVGNV